MIFVDSSVWIDYFNGIQNPHTDKLDFFLKKELVVIGDIVLAEVLQGFHYDDDFVRAKKALSYLFCFTIGGKNLAIKCAENYRYLRKKGITPRKTVDMLIGTFCIENDLPLLHRDNDFEPLIKLLGLNSVI
ncbi:MAG: PIN domain-containing protein [Bacteroidetes bacterium]|nr:PIN domain-containing protein [Bacteroidota bacterium]